MVASVLGVVGFVALLLLAVGILNPVLAVTVAVLALAPLAIILAAGAFSGGRARVPAEGPRVPSTAEASYEPVADPSHRN